MKNVKMQSQECALLKGMHVMIHLIKHEEYARDDADD